MRVAIYARVSADDKGQDPENQLREHFVILVLPL
jgi:predicted site-specific integrase-resolvase